MALFEKWSRRINLTAASTHRDVLRRHVLDSLQLVEFEPRPLKWVDLGSGAGFPGLILGISLAESGDGWVHLVESNRKKAAFLRAAIVETGARATVHPIRADVAYAAIGACDAVSSRALAGLGDLLGLAEPWLADERPAAGWFHKGRDYEREIGEARRSWRFDLVEHRSRIKANSVILEVANVERL